MKAIPFRLCPNFSLHQDMEEKTVSNDKTNELLDAQTQIWNQMFSFHNSMAVKCAIQLGIPEAIHSYGKPMSLKELANVLPIHSNKASSLHRLMRLLVHSNFFSYSMVHEEPVFELTVKSRLLLKDHPLSQVPTVLTVLQPTWITTGHHLDHWFRSDDESPFHTAYGQSFWEYASQSASLNKDFNELMAGDTKLTASILMDNLEFRNLLDGVESLVDVGGGVGIMAKAIAESHPGIECRVLDLPHVVERLESNVKNLVYVGGDMFDAIPPAEVVFLKSVLHDWSDEDCIKILNRCKEAIQHRASGKVIVVDTVMEEPCDVPQQSSSIQSAQLLSDMQMLTFMVGGKERTEQEWKKLLKDAKFSSYKMYSILGVRSVIVAYP